MNRGFLLETVTLNSILLFQTKIKLDESRYLRALILWQLFVDHLKKYQNI